MSDMRRGIAARGASLPCATEAEDRERVKAVETLHGQDEARRSARTLVKSMKYM